MGTDVLSDLPALGFIHGDMFIYDPFVSECGRFEVDPQATYDISVEEANALKKLNKSIADATDAALDAGCADIQEALGVTTGDVAGIYFSDRSESLPIAKALADYALHEVVMAQAEDR